jgi:hypothetical protein
LFDAWPLAPADGGPLPPPLAVFVGFGEGVDDVDDAMFMVQRYVYNLEDTSRRLIKSATKAVSRGRDREKIHFIAKGYHSQGIFPFSTFLFFFFAQHTVVRLSACLSDDCCRRVQRQHLIGVDIEHITITGAGGRFLTPADLKNDP